MGLVNLCEGAHASLIVRFLTYLRNEIVAAVQTLFLLSTQSFECPVYFGPALPRHSLGPWR